MGRLPFRHPGDRDRIAAGLAAAGIDAGLRLPPNLRLSPADASFGANVNNS
jgi:hypothetical protein